MIFKSFYFYTLKIEIGIFISILQSFLYNSGDTCIINEDIVNKFNNNEIDYIYHEVSNDGYKVHMDIDVLAIALKKIEIEYIVCI